MFVMFRVRGWFAGIYRVIKAKIPEITVMSIDNAGLSK